MNDKQENKLAMYRAVQAVCLPVAAQIQSVPALVDALGDFTALLGAIGKLGVDHETSTNGITEHKGRLRGELADATVVIIGQIQALAASLRDEPLAASVDFTSTQLLRGRDSAAADRAEKVHEVLVAKLTALAPYGATAATVAAHRAAIDAYVATLTAPREAVVNRTAVTASLAERFAEADEVLEEKMDRLVPLFKKALPDFVKRYEHARIVVEGPRGDGGGGPGGPTPPPAPSAGPGGR